jgi:hypothetical protein
MLSSSADDTAQIQNGVTKIEWVNMETDIESQHKNQDKTFDQEIQHIFNN